MPAVLSGQTLEAAARAAGLCPRTADKWICAVKAEGMEASPLWRDLGYAIGALVPGLAAHLAGEIETAFWFVAASMLLSGLVLLIWGEETLPGLVVPTPGGDRANS